MKKDILQKGVILPLIIGVILAIAFSAFLHSTSLFQTLANNSVVAYHDEINVKNDMVSVEKISDCSINDNIGSIVAGNEEIMVRYNADYSSMIGSVSFIDGVAFGDGVSYLETTSAIAESIAGSNEISYKGTFGEHKYKLNEKKSYGGRYAALSDLATVNKGIVLIYQTRDNGGLSSKYTALIFEEVA